MPDFSNVKPIVKSDNSATTAGAVFQEFNLQTEKRMNGERKSVTVETPSSTSHFQALKMPNFGKLHDMQMVTSQSKPRKSDATMPVGFELKSEARSMQHQKSFQDKLKKEQMDLERVRQFKA